MSQTCLWFTYCKAVVNTILSQLDLSEKLSFKVTEKKVGGEGFRQAGRQAGRQAIVPMPAGRSDEDACLMPDTWK